MKDLQTAPAMIQTGDGSTLSHDDGPNPIAVAAVVVTIIGAAGAAFVTRARRAT